jgi:MscS family membrane protein
MLATFLSGYRTRSETFVHLVLTCVAAVVLATSMAAAQGTADPTDAARPYLVRTDSPQETATSFRQVAAAMQVAFDSYTATRDRETARTLRHLRDQWLELIDLSAVPNSARSDVGALTLAYMLDIFNRVALQDPTAAVDGSPAVYQIPDTPFRIIRIDTGPRQGEFLFSGQTVHAAARFHESVRTLPLRSDNLVGNWVRALRQLTGPMVPAALVNAVPASLEGPLFGTPLWKVVGVAALTVIAGIVLWLWNRITTRPAWGGPVGQRWRLLLSPLALLLAAYGLRMFITTQIIVVDPFATAVFAVLTVVGYLAIAWAFWVVMLAVFETAIHHGGLPDQDFNADMLRLTGRIIGFIGGVIILAYGAQDIGLPVFSLLAGLGIGGLAIALAIRPTLENLIGGFILYLDKPIRVGDFCTFGDRSGSVESIGVRSTQIRALDRTLITVPNAQFADMQIVNWAQCDRMLIKQVIGLRYETGADQLRHVLVKLREMLIGHPRVDSETVRVRFADYGASSLDLDMRIYVMTREWNDFFAIKEDILLRTKTIVEQSGTGFAFPSQTLYMAQDRGIDTALGEQASQEVAALRRARQLPFPHFSASRLEELDGRLRYPPPGSPDIDATPEELAEAGGEPLSTEAPPDAPVPPIEDTDHSDETTRK